MTELTTISENMIIIKKPKKSLLDYEGFLGRTLPCEKEVAAAGLAKHVLGVGSRVPI